MKILCKVMPSSDICCACIDSQLNGYTETKECYECITQMPDYEILQFGHSLFGRDWAVVLSSGGVLERVALKRIMNVRTIH